VVEGVVGGKAFRPSGGQKRRVPADENQGKPESRQNAGVSQGDSQLNGIVSLQGVALGEVGGELKVRSPHRKGIENLAGDIPHKSPKSPIARLERNPPSPVKDSEGCHSTTLASEIQIGWAGTPLSGNRAFIRPLTQALPGSRM
jgi:hypothetical protein